MNSQLKIKVLLLIVILVCLLVATVIFYFIFHKPQIFVISPLVMIMATVPVLLSMFNDVTRK